jgi:hypothetical protein
MTIAELFGRLDELPAEIRTRSKGRAGHEVIEMESGTTGCE